MKTSKKAEMAVNYKHTANNCAQAVLLAFQDEIGKSAEELKALSSGFGSGMGGLEATCGALVGAGIVMGLLNHTDKPTKFIMKDVVDEFKAETGATACCDLKGVGTGKVLCPCDDCIRAAVVAIEERL